MSRFWIPIVYTNNVLCTKWSSLAKFRLPFFYVLYENPTIRHPTCLFSYCHHLMAFILLIQFNTETDTEHMVNSIRTFLAQRPNAFRSAVWHPYPLFLCMPSTIACQWILVQTYLSRCALHIPNGNGTNLPIPTPVQTCRSLMQAALKFNQYKNTQICHITTVSIVSFICNSLQYTVTIWIPNTWIPDSMGFRFSNGKVTWLCGHLDRGFSVWFSDHHLTNGHKSTIQRPD